MIVKKFTLDGNVSGEIELADSVFKAKINKTLLYELIKAANANLRQGTHATKERSFVSGGGIKPYRQKGTGRARQGSIRSPQYRGGGIVFGPRPRDYRIDLPKKFRKEAIKSILSLKLKNDSIKIIDNFTSESGKTKDIAKIGKSLKIEKGVLLTVNEDTMLKRAIRNIPWFVYNNAKRISGRDIYYTKTLLITEDAVEYLNNNYKD